LSRGSDGAVAAAVAVARAQDLRSGRPIVPRDAWHVLVHLAPAPVVARVSNGVPYPEGPHPDDVVRELHVARHAVRAGAPVVPPAEGVDPGPHVQGDHVVTLWTYVEARGAVDARAAGRGLRAIHEALLDYDGPPLAPAGHADDVEPMLACVEPSADVELLREVASRRPDAARQPLHGDAHLANCMPTPGGPLWHDLESTCLGPREYDLAALVLHDRSRGGHAPSRQALAAYGEHDAELLDALLPVYAAWVYASFLVALPRRPELAAVVRDRMQWLRRVTETTSAVTSSTPLRPAPSRLPAPRRRA
jgi:Ser/Thr protein kinase RdoA (MazF antagonist)